MLTTRTQKSAPRRGRIVAGGLSLLILAGGAAFVVYAWDYWVTSGDLGIDYRLMVAWAERFLATGQPYLPYQLAGPYVVGDHVGADSPIMYPPTLLYLMVPFVWLPAILWWAIPLGVTGWAIWKLNPRPMVWPVLALLVAFPQTLWFVATGNPLMWFVAAAALGAYRGGWAALVVLKPTLAPFALLGVWRPSWWITLAGIGFASLALTELWVDYLTIVGNTAANVAAGYNLNQWPAMMIPVLAWLGSQRHREVRGVQRGIGRVVVDAHGAGAERGAGV
jgi:hypothetical protein